MPVDDRIKFFGIGIESVHERRVTFYGTSISFPSHTDIGRQPPFYGLAIDADVAFNATFKVVDTTNNQPISNAAVTVTSTQTPPNNYVGNLSGFTDANGFFAATGSVMASEITISKEGFQTYTGPPLTTMRTGTLLFPLSPAAAGGSSKKIYTTNKGNVLINPNDTVLIELD